MKKLFGLLFALMVTFLCTFSSVEAKIKISPYEIVSDPQGVYIVEINTSKIKNKLVPFIVEELETNKSVYERTQSRFSVNAGFFDAKNQETVSYVVIDGETVLDPTLNERLMNNKVLEPYLDKILNRSEFRIIEDEEGNIEYDIARHNDPVKEGFKIKHSIQGGPLLFPDLKLEEEFFILKKDGKIISESASALHKHPRTAIGIRDNNVYLFIATRENPMTLEELSDLTRKWGMEKALGFDGGGSTSFDAKEIHINCEKDNTQRKVKSFLILKSNQKSQ